MHYTVGRVRAAFTVLNAKASLGETMKTIQSSVIACLVVAGVNGCSGPDAAEPTGNAGQDLRVGQHDHIVQVLSQTNLVSDQPGVAAHTDTNLVNAWGLAFNPNGPAWVSDNEPGLASVFDSTGNTLLTVTLPVQGSVAPTGQVFNGDATAFHGDRFIIASEDGTVVGWQPNVGAQTRVTSTTGAVYKGLATALVDGHPRLYLADFHNNRIDVFDANYAPITTSSERFEDDHLPDHYAPFNIVTHDNALYVAYALQKLPEAKDDDAGAGHGFVDVYSTRGRLRQRLISRGALNSPWGMAFTPDDFGHISDRLLVGNFGDGHINVYRAPTCQSGDYERVWHSDRDRDCDRDDGAQFIGAIGSDRHHALVIDGLWALVFGPDAGGSNSHQLYFTAGPDDESHGLFGRLEVPSHDDW